MDTEALSKTRAPRCINRFWPEKIYSFILSCFLIIPPAAGDPQKKDFDSLAMAALSYASAARACQNHSVYRKAKSALSIILNFGFQREFLHGNILSAYYDTEKYLQRGEYAYKQRPFVTCGDVVKYVNLISKAADRLKNQ